MSWRTLIALGLVALIGLFVLFSALETSGRENDRLRSRDEYEDAKARAKLLIARTPLSARYRAELRRLVWQIEDYERCEL